MNRSQESDVALVTAIGKGDRLAFRVLYERYQEEMYRLALRKTYEKEVAEEIVQDIFVDLWENRERMAIGQVRHYLLRSIRNRVLDYIRAQIVRQNYAKQYATNGEEAAHLTDDWMALCDLNDAIQTGIAEMPDKTREIFKLNRLDQLSADEIAGTLRIPKRTVEYHITVALRIMRKCLKDFLPLWLVAYFL
ncbi:RNA polymerase sigma-70 factor [Dyadobacter sp. CY261]|uniref:RNA polymerase sigma-70 factor n=1 Tax=Dyadobacter sp. CY261 TaxID=2907203 RepID=UPI001F2484D8|nr:RNA polymerase sigma-70 factor [Dyadobacter sp. CY261]MCF0074080.1 RNA polymerase sigma-70 factor [Dyadobacter sp. CY261]